MEQSVINKKLNTDLLKRILTVLLFLLTPLWAALIISLESHTSLLKYDAYNASNENWSDEPNYYIEIRQIRDYVVPQNVRSYNEVEPEKIGYGVYGPTTYVPYVLASFFTGTTSHNYVVYCNLILILIANISFICIARPTNKQLLWLSLILSICLPYERYVWSGMTEASHCAMAIIMIACGLYLFGEESKSTKKEILVLCISVFLPTFYGTIRGYQFIFILIPLVYIFSRMRGKKRIIATSLTMVVLIAGMYLYIFVLSKYCSPYYASEESFESTIKFREYIKGIFNGDFGPFFSEVITKNNEALARIGRQMQNGKWQWVPAIGPLFVITLMVLGIIFDKELKKKKLLIITYIVIVLIFIESIIVMERFGHIDRYGLEIWICGYYLLCCMSVSKVNKRLWLAGVISLGLIVSIIVFGYGTKFKFPQVSEEITYNDEELKSIFAELMPKDDENLWNNTVASGGSVTYLRFLYPSYIGNSTCKPSFLEELIKTDSVKSKYISVIEKTKKQTLIELCDEKYELIYHDYGLRLYKVR